MFVDAEYGDLHLEPFSPMVNAGYSLLPNLPETDFFGGPRIVASAVDIGADEFDGFSLSIARVGTGGGHVTSNAVGIDCGSRCSYPYPTGSLVTLTATPDDLSVFDGWSGNADCADGQVTLNADLACTATFTALQQLTVARAGLGSGTVTSAPAGIDCGFYCSALFYPGDPVDLTARPAANSTLAGWSGDASCPNLILTSDRLCTAHFDPLYYRLYLFVYGTGGGSVTSAPAGITCGTDCEEDYRATTVVTLTAAPDANSNFWGWTGPCTGSEPTCEVTLSAISGLAAIFNLKTYPLSVTKAGTGTGTVTSAPGSINCGTHCSEAFDHGATVTLTAVPEASSTFTGWSGACTGTTACQVTLVEAKSVTATFALQRYTVTATAGANGAIDPPTRDLDHGATTSFTVTPTTGYSASVSGCGGTLAGNIYTTGPITAACTVTATFILNSYSLSTAVSPAGAGTVNCTATTIGYGGASTCTATANAGYSFGFWSGDCAGATCALTNITSNKSVTANFARNSYALSVTKAGTGTGTVSSDPGSINCGTNCQETFDHGATVTLTAVPDASATFTGWSGACTGAESCQVTLEEAQSVTATFALMRYTVTATAGANGAIDPLTRDLDHGTTTTFTVTPTTGYSASVSGCGGTLAGNIYTMGPITAACPVTTTFTLNSYSLSTAVSPAGAGTVTCTAYQVPHGGASTCTATAHAGYSFGFWSGDCAGATCALTNITSNKSITANFARNSYALSVTKAGTGTGTVTSDPGAIDCGTNCQETFEHGALVTLTATPDASSTFTGWSGACTGAGACQVQMEEAQRVTATFTLKRYTVTATAGTGGSISPATRSVNHGASTTFTVTPATGYRIGTVSGCGGSLAGGTYTTGAIIAACPVRATFTLLPKYTLTVTKGGTGTVTSAPAGIACGATCRAAFTSGTRVTLTAKAGTGYAFSTWTGCTSVSGTSCTVAMTGAKAVKAVFKPAFKLSLAKSGYAYGTVTSAPNGIGCGTACSATSALFPAGATVTLIATPITGRSFKNWSGACTGVGTSCAVPMTKARSVTAVFE